MKNKILYLLIILSLILTSCMNKKQSPPPPAINIENMNFDVDPGNDFFKYVNGGWIEKNPIPDEYSQYGAFIELIDQNREILKNIVLEVSEKNAKEGTISQKIGDFYSSGMDTAKIEKLGIIAIEKYLKNIEKIKTIENVQNIIPEFHKYGISALFHMFASTDDKNSDMEIANLYQGGLGLGDVDYYSADDSRSKEIRTEYVAHISRMLQLAGETKEEAIEHTSKIMVIETRLAKHSMTRLERRDPQKTYNKKTLKELQDISKDFNWTAYFKNLDIPKSGDIIVRQPEFFAEISKMMADVNVDDWKAYLKWNLINHNAHYLNSDFVNTDFDFYGTFLSGQKTIKPRWKRILSTTSGSLGEPIGKLFVQKHFPPEAKERMEDLVANLKSSLANRIRKTEWMSETTKIKALDKLTAMTVKIGYPDKWIDYSSLKIVPDSFITNIRNANNFEFKRNIEKIGKPVNKEEWIMPPQTVNAGYIPTYNEIVFPAGILQPPFFYLNADDAVNYGAIGVVIGHEMTHGFDDQGRQYDKDGNLADWWTDEDAANFKERTVVLVDHFDNFTVLDSLNVNGKLTLGENIADLGGMNISYDALINTLAGNEMNDIDGFSPAQRFFLSYAQVWRQNIRNQELMRRLKEDVHSPGIARVNGAIVNMPYFYEAFDIDSTNKLFLEESKRVKIW
ncbi:MAG: M13 family metallopeptidase [Bacteroidales bacterium]|nr:M13 family metallopeptidase [Bacteroidales bacterium]